MAPAVIAALISAASAAIPYILKGFKGLKNVGNAATGSGLTDAELQANAFNVAQSEKQMMFQQQMANTQYQRGVIDMKSAGLNPALMYGSGASGNSAATGSMASSVTPVSSIVEPLGLLSQIADLALLPTRKRQMESEINKTNAEAQQ